MKSLRTFLLGFAMFSLCAPLAQAQNYYESDGGLYNYAATKEDQ